VLILGFADAPEGGAKTHADAMLRSFPRVIDAGIIERELRRRDCKLRVAIESSEALRRKMLLWSPVADFAGAPHLKRLGIETGDATDAGFFGENSVPKFLASASDASDGTDSSNDRAPSAHAITVLAFDST
jgi:hypothetical protein